MENSENIDQILNNQRSNLREELAELRILNQSNVSNRISRLTQTTNPNLVTDDQNNNNDNGVVPDQTISEIDEELRNLIHSQRVSTLLNNARFRRNLEERMSQSLSSLASSSSRLTPSETSSARINVIQPPAVQTNLVEGASNQSGPALNTQVSIDRVIDPDSDPEISALLNFQIVSNILQSAFRNHLESTIWSRYASRQTGSELAQEDHTPIPSQSANQTSNFVQSNLRDAYSGTTTHGSLLQRMQREINDIRQMMLVLVQSQVETQRFMRQEVSQVINQASRDAQPSREVSLCCICLETEADTMIYRCGHICLCYPCSVSLRINRVTAGSSLSNSQPILTCPVCRSVVHDVVRVFNSKTVSTQQDPPPS